MVLRFFCIWCFAILLLGCNHKNYVHTIEGKQISISDSISSDNTIEAYVKPYRERINSDLDSTIAYAVDTYTKSDGELNTAIGNLMADIVYTQANPVFKLRSGKDIDFVLINQGGIRSIISKGNISKRTAFELMPFENSIVVVELAGREVKQLVDYLVEQKRAHPISKLQITLNNQGEVLYAGINGVPLDYTKTYFVATNDYLYNGGDHMDFFKTNKNLYVLDYKIRNALIDYFVKVDTLNPVIDDRFIIKKR